MKELPLQIVAFIFVTAGKELTVIVDDAVLEQPEDVPVTVYVVVMAGETVIVFPMAPLLQEYVVAPLAVIVTGVSLHTLIVAGDNETTGAPILTVTSS